eukprot:89631-Alexandrium_andersonii.AAC.1
MTPNPPGRDLRGRTLRPFLGPRSSSFERLNPFCNSRISSGMRPNMPYRPSEAPQSSLELSDP